jgi:hypothetical protein
LITELTNFLSERKIILFTLTAGKKIKVQYGMEKDIKLVSLQKILFGT